MARQRLAGIRVETKVISIPGATAADPVCVDNPSGCCPEALDCGSHCTTGPEEWSLTVAGITDDTCADCENLNGEFTLVFAPTEIYPCRWASVEVFALCGISENQWCLFYDSGGTPHWQLQARNVSGDAEASRPYTKADEDWNCLATNTLDLGGAFPGCGTYPATLTVTPV